ncbi:MAG: KdsC family phosphatase [Phycisphaerae bacterium]
MDDSGIELLIFDADGVLTDGRIVVDEAGGQIRTFSVQDGMGIRLWREAGGRTAILSGQSCRAVAHRAAQLQIDRLVQGCHDKLAGFEQLVEQLAVPADRTCFMGDDLPDLPVMRRCGYPVAVANAVAEVKAVARYVTRRPGGAGAIRETVEHLLRRAGRWNELTGRYY